MRELEAMTTTLPIVTLGLAQGSRQSARAMRAGDGETADYAGAAAETAEFERAAANSIVLLGARPDDAREWDLTAAVTKSRFGLPGRVGIHFNGATGVVTELDQVPATQTEIERGNDIVEQVVTHAAGRANGGCKCEQESLTANALSKKNGHHKVAGTKGTIKKVLLQLEQQGRLRNEGGVLLPAMDR